MTRKEEDTNTYKARTIRVKNSTPLASILDEWSHAATRLYNSATFVRREESYTSKASLVDGDFIPTYGVDERPSGGWKFSGAREHRGLYRSRKSRLANAPADKSGERRGVILNADVNGAGNILRKEHGDAFGSVSDWRYLMNSLRVGLSVSSHRNKCNVSRDGSPSE